MAKHPTKTGGEINAQQLAKILCEEFIKDEWEEIDVYHLRKIAEGETDDVTAELLPVIKNIAARLNTEMTIEHSYKAPKEAAGG